MASVAYNFMVADPNSHSRRYNEHNCGHDPRRSSSVTIDLVSDTGTGTHVVKRRKSRKKSTAIVVVKERVSISILVYSFTSKTVYNLCSCSLLVDIFYKTEQTLTLMLSDGSCM